MADEIINKVAEAGIEQIDLKDFLLKKGVVEIDLKNQLWNDFVLKEKDFRDWIKIHDWSVYENKVVALYCSADAVIPAWAYMLVTAELKNAGAVYFSSPEKIHEEYFFDQLKNWNVNQLLDKRVMVKGCSDIPNPEKAYVILTQKLMPVVKSLMFGEPCSAVPVYKKK
ncbi:MAG: DUF2480 family protein [Crocinitomicaceae bacterium]|nr:DUF2480 family protein [Crocinitomicaceae bacterium]